MAEELAGLDHSPADALSPEPGRPSICSPAGLPNFLVIGAQRAGTTLLHQILDRHPEVYVPQARKEIHFFDRYHDRGPDWYRGYFTAALGQPGLKAIGEVTPDYLACPFAASRARDLLPGCRLIVILRQPVDRAISWHRYVQRSHGETRDLATFFAANEETREAGRYAHHLARWLEHFAAPSVLILIYEELVAAPDRELERLRGLLGLQAGWRNAEALLAERVNDSELPRLARAFVAARRLNGLLYRFDLNWPARTAKALGLRRLFGRRPSTAPVGPELRARIGAFYRDDIERLENLLGRPIDAWRQPPA